MRPRARKICGKNIVAQGTRVTLHSYLLPASTSNEKTITTKGQIIHITSRCDAILWDAGEPLAKGGDPLVSAGSLREIWLDKFESNVKPDIKCMLSLH